MFVFFPSRTDDVFKSHHIHHTHCAQFYYRVVWERSLNPHTTFRWTSTTHNNRSSINNNNNFIAFTCVVVCVFWSSYKNSRFSTSSAHQSHMTRDAPSHQARPDIFRVLHMWKALTTYYLCVCVWDLLFCRCEVVFFVINDQNTFQRLFLFCLSFLFCFLLLSWLVFFI